MRWPSRAVLTKRWLVMTTSFLKFRPDGKAIWPQALASKAQTLGALALLPVVLGVGRDAVPYQLSLEPTGWRLSC